MTCNDERTNGQSNAKKGDVTTADYSGPLRKPNKMAAQMQYVRFTADALSLSNDIYTAPRLDPFAAIITVSEHVARIYKVTPFGSEQ